MAADAGKVDRRDADAPSHVSDFRGEGDYGRGDHASQPDAQCGSLARLPEPGCKQQDDGQQEAGSPQVGDELPDIHCERALNVKTIRQLFLSPPCG
jgi:hypothetical protein